MYYDEAIHLTDAQIEELTQKVRHQAAIKKVNVKQRGIQSLVIVNTPRNTAQR